MRMLRWVLAALLLIAVSEGAEAHMLKKDCKQESAYWVDEDPTDNGLLTSDPSAVVVLGSGGNAQCGWSCVAGKEISIIYGCGSHASA